MSSLRDQVALVTGSSRGIGAAIAKSFAQQGAKVVVHGRDGAALSSIRKEIELASGRSMQVRGDVTNFTDIEAARLRIEGEFGPVDILVANAGGSFTPPGPLEDTSEEGWRASVDGNLTATFLTIKSFLPGMKERRTWQHHHDLLGGWAPSAPQVADPCTQSRRLGSDSCPKMLQHKPARTAFG